MTASEAALLARRLREFVGRELPGNNDMIHMLSDLLLTLEHMSERDLEQGIPAILGNLNTGEVKLVDSRDWRYWGVEWIDGNEGEADARMGRKEAWKSENEK